MIAYILLGIIVIIILVIYKIRSSNNDLDFALTKVHEGENVIDDLLNRKANLIDEICESINKVNDKNVFSNVKKEIKKNVNSFRYDKDLADIYLELKEYLFVNKSFIPEDEIKNKIYELDEIEVNLQAAKNFYNDNSVLFNSLIGKFPIRIIAQKRGYDLKNLYTFEEEQFFEILKDSKMTKKIDKVED